MNRVKRLEYRANLTQQEKDIDDIETMENLIKLYKAHVSKKIIPRLPPNSIQNIKAAMGWTEII